MNYREEVDAAKIYKTNYINGLEHIIKTRQKDAEKKRYEYTKNIFTDAEGYREDLKEMLGWPLVDYHKGSDIKVISELLSEEDGYDIYRMQFEILDGLKLTGLLFRQRGEDKKPMVIVQHGGLGTPELISGVYGGTSNYNDMLHRVIKNGVHAFAPQLLLWNEIYGDNFDRKSIDAHLKRVGSSIAAIEVFGITRIMDYFEENVSSFGMVGLSYGGFFTLYTAAIDTRIKSALSCSFFNKRDEIGWPDWTWFKSAEKFDDAEVACLIYPRKLCIEMGDKDELFDYHHSVASFEKIKLLCREVGTDWVDFKVFEGTHEFCKDDEPIRRLIDDIR